MTALAAAARYLCVLSSAVTLSTYFFMASSGLTPLSLAQASSRVIVGLPIEVRPFEH
jgi:hypothetical protein